MILKDILMSIALIAAVVVPTWLLIKASNKTRRLLTNELMRINKTLPDTYDIWNRRAIATNLDLTLTFINLHNQDEVYLNLEEVSSCYLLVNKQKYNHDKIDLKTADSVDLVLQHKGKSIKLNMYDAKIDDPVEGGQNVAIAKKYEQMIKKSLLQNA